MATQRRTFHAHLLGLGFIIFAELSIRLNHMSLSLFHHHLLLYMIFHAVFLLYSASLFIPCCRLPWFLLLLLDLFLYQLLRPDIERSLQQSFPGALMQIQGLLQIRATHKPLLFCWILLTRLLLLRKHEGGVEGHFRRIRTRWDIRYC